MVVSVRPKRSRALCVGPTARLRGYHKGRYPVGVGLGFSLVYP
jgi:hypothetical protein